MYHEPLRWHSRDESFSAAQPRQPSPRPRWVCSQGPEGSSLVATWAAATSEQDVRILNTALSAEHEAVAAYQVGAESGLLKKDALDLAVQFQGQHKEHVDLLAATVKKLGGSPTGKKESYAFPVEKLKNAGRRAALRGRSREGRSQRLPELDSHSGKR